MYDPSVHPWDDPTFVPTPIARGALASPILREGLDYWLSKRGASGLPARRDLDPTEIPRLLPYVELSEVIDEGADFRFRLVGSHLVDTDDINPTGKTFSAFFRNPTYARYQLALYRWVVHRQRPLYSGSRIPLPARGHAVLTERLYLPLSGDGRRVDLVLNFQVCEGVADAGLALEDALDPVNGESFVHAVQLDD